MAHLKTKPNLLLQKKPNKGQSSEFGKEGTIQCYKEALDNFESERYDTKIGIIECQNLVERLQSISKDNIYGYY